MSKKGLVSICIPVYNAFNYIEETINSFLYQSYQNIEIIITDDCSTDGTWELLLEKYSSNNIIKLYRNDFNLGVGTNWNKCYNFSKGEFVVIANGDDIYFENFIHNAIKIFSNNHMLDVIFSGHDILVMKDFKRKKNTSQINIKSGIVIDPFEVIYFSNPFLFQFAVSRRSVLENAVKSSCNKSLFLETQICDCELQLRLAKNGSIIYFDSQIFGLYRRHDSNISLSRFGEKNSYYNIISLYHNYLKINYSHKYLKRRLWEVGQLFKDLFRNPIRFNFKLLLKSIYLLLK